MTINFRTTTINIRITIYNVNNLITSVFELSSFIIIFIELLLNLQLIIPWLLNVRFWESDLFWTELARVGTVNMEITNKGHKSAPPK